MKKDGELTEIRLNPPQNQGMQNIFKARTRAPLFYSGLSDDTKFDLNELQNIRNGEELMELGYLLTKTENVQ
jgi:hypothetical protein